MGVFVCRTILSFTVDSRSRSLTLSLHFGTKYSTQPVTSPCILHDSANDILPMLQQHNAADIDVAYRKSVFRLLNGPALFGRASDLEYPRPTSWNALRQHPDEALVDEFKSVLPCALRPFPQLRCILFVLHPPRYQPQLTPVTFFLQLKYMSQHRTTSTIAGILPLSTPA